MSNKLDWDEVARKVCNYINEPYYRLLDLRFLMLVNIENNNDYGVKYRPTFTKDEYDIAYSRDEFKSLWAKLYK